MFFKTDVYVPTKANAFAVRIVLCFFAKKQAAFCGLQCFVFSGSVFSYCLAAKKFDVLRFQVDFLTKDCFASEICLRQPIHANTLS